jgi:CHAT domain-containing protein
VFHFSGHGNFDPVDPGRTGVVVSAPAAGGESIVNIAELAALDCSRLRLATVLSCWSADTFLFPGRWAVNIPASLCRAGAGAVVAPLWEIEDRLSTDMLKAFYTALETVRVDEAVRAAQLQVRTGSDGRSRPAYFWAGLQVAGDSSRVRPGRRRRTWRN